MKIEKDINKINENEFTAIFGSVFEKSEWIAAETFKLKPFNWTNLLMSYPISFAPSAYILLSLYFDTCNNDTKFLL